MGTDGNKSSISRRDMLKKSVVAGGIAWVAPAVLSSPAYAANPCNCSPGALFGLKRNNQNSGTGNCEAPGNNPSTGNCGASAGITDVRPGCCLETAGLITFSGGGSTHTWTLAAGVRLCAAFAKGGQSGCEPVAGVPGPNGTTVVTISANDLSHSEIYVCMDGTVIPAICN